MDEMAEEASDEGDSELDAALAFADSPVGI